MTPSERPQRQIDRGPPLLVPGFEHVPWWVGVSVLLVIAETLMGLVGVLITIVIVFAAAANALSERQDKGGSDPGDDPDGGGGLPRRPPPVGGPWR